METKTFKPSLEQVLSLSRSRPWPQSLQYMRLRKERVPLFEPD
jgi:hypothetical protein